MKKTALITLATAATFCLGFSLNEFVSKHEKNLNDHGQTKNHIIKKSSNMKLGAFSVSLNVKDLTVSKEFYEHLGFSVFAGSMQQNYLIMKNESALIGLFQGMFTGNILTFNPGWDENAKNLGEFDDVREIQRQLKSNKIQLTAEADEKTSGPASLMTTDPDGNVILVDQHR